MPPLFWIGTSRNAASKTIPPHHVASSVPLYSRVLEMSSRSALRPAFVACSIAASSAAFCSSAVSTLAPVAALDALTVFGSSVVGCRSVPVVGVPAVAGVGGAVV